MNHFMVFIITLMQITTTYQAVVFGSDHTLRGMNSGVSILGSDIETSNSSDSNLFGHEGIMHSSDEASSYGNNINITNSDTAIGIGHSINIHNADSSILIGNHLRTSTSSQIVLGSYNTDSDALFVIASGSDTKLKNIFEIFKNGTIKNDLISQMQEDIKNMKNTISILQNQFTQLSACKNDIGCIDIKAAYQGLGCCVVNL